MEASVTLDAAEMGSIRAFSTSDGRAASAAGFVSESLAGPNAPSRPET